MKKEKIVVDVHYNLLLLILKNLIEANRKVPIEISSVPPNSYVCVSSEDMFRITWIVPESHYSSAHYGIIMNFLKSLQKATGSVFFPELDKKLNKHLKHLP